MRVGNKWVTKTEKKLESGKCRKYAPAFFWIWIIAAITMLILLSK
jgi:hypothetical protein